MKQRPRSFGRCHKAFNFDPWNKLRGDDVGPAMGIPCYPRYPQDPTGKSHFLHDQIWGQTDTPSDHVA